MKTPKILIVVRGGLVQAISANQEVDVMLVDWDNIEAGDPIPDDFDYPVDVYNKIHPQYEDANYRREAELYQQLKALDV